MTDADALHRHRPYLYAVGDAFETRSGPLTIVEALRVQHEDKIYRKKYRLQCQRGHQYLVDEAYLRAGRLRTCKKCSHPPIAETDPQFAAWFVDPAVPAEKAHGSHDAADFYCQKCGKIVTGKSIHNIYKRSRVLCPCCTGGISYPERYLDALLTQLEVPFLRQYTAKCQLGGRKSHYRYDFYDRARALLIETHGAQHFLPGVFERMGGYSLEKIQLVDREKKAFAEERLGLHYIYLDCRKSDPAWIRRECMKKLGAYYPLAAVDWQQVAGQANSSLTLQLIALCRQGYTQSQIGQMVRLHPGTVCHKLQRAVEDGLFDGVTPRMIRTEENKRLAAERKARALAAAQQREELRRLMAERQLSRAQHQGPADHDSLLRALREQGLSYTVLDEYVNGRTPLRFLCTQCGQSFQRTPKAILSDPLCPLCRKLDQLRQTAREKYTGGYEIPGPYIDGKTPLQIRHTACGSVFFKTAGQFLQSGCPRCAEEARLAKARQSKVERGIRKFYASLPEIAARGYTFIGETCSGWGARNAFRYGHCGELWMTTALNILQGRRHICVSPCKKKTHLEFETQVRALSGGEYTVLGRYRDALTPIELRHDLCGRTFLIPPAHFTSTGRRCPFCTDTRRRSGDPAREEALLGYQQSLILERAGLRDADGRLPSHRMYLWNKKLADAKAFFASRGHVDIPYGHIVNGYDLGGWISEQRKSRRLGRLSCEQIGALDELGMKWQYKEENWLNTYRLVKAWLECQGPLRLTSGSTRQERSLCYWLNDQTELYRSGRLTREKEAQLEAIGVRRECKSDFHFNTMCEKLRRFEALHHHCVVPLEEGRGEAHPLGLWAQRMRMQLAAGQVHPQRAETLRALGLPSNNKSAKFQQKLSLLSAYYHRNGHLRIPQSCVEDGHRLGKWINTLRVNYGKGRLSEEQVSALERIGMVWQAGRAGVAPAPTKDTPSAGLSSGF